MKTRRLSAVLVLCVCLVSQAQAFICDEPRKPRTEEVRRAYEGATLVALVRVLHTHYAIEERDGAGHFVGLEDLSQSEAQTRLAAEFQPHDAVDAGRRMFLLADVQVLKTWKGTPSLAQTIGTWPTVGSGGVPFAEGQTWLVFADGPDHTGLPQTITCSPASLERDATRDVSILDEKYGIAASAR